MELLKRWLPILQRLDSYGAEQARGDLAAGLTTAVMLIPQGMAYAMLAGLPPIVGLYASTVPVVIYALFGTSRQLSVGPAAMVSLLTAAGLGAVADGGASQVVVYAVLLALMVGVLQLTMGLARVGMVTNFLSHPVLSGFSSAAALIIGFSQLKHLLGLDLARSDHVHEIIVQAYLHLGQVQPTTLAIGLVSIVALFALRRLRPMFPRALTVVVVGTLVVWGFGLDEQGVATIGSVPAGLPGFAMPEFSWPAMQRLIPTAVTIALVGFMESIAVALRVAENHRQDEEIDANQELVGLGLANIGGAFTGSYPVAGGFSRTAVNDQAGAQTSVSGLVSAMIVGVVLLFLTPLLYYLPTAVLAAIIITAVLGLVDVEEVRHLWKVKPSDLALLAITFVATLSVGIEEGILIGVGASIAWHVYKTTKPHTVVLGRLPNTTSYRNVAHYPHAKTVPGILTLRIDSQFYFGNVTFLKETLRQHEAEMDAPLRAVVIDASSVNQLDSSADRALHAVVDRYMARGVGVYFAKAKGPVLEVMKRSSLYETLGRQHFTYRVHEAIMAAVEDKYEKIHLENIEREDPHAPEESKDPPMRRIESVHPEYYRDIASRHGE